MNEGAPVGGVADGDLVCERRVPDRGGCGRGRGGEGVEGPRGVDARRARSPGCENSSAASAEHFAVFHRRYGPIVADAQRHRQLRAELARLEAELAASATRKVEAERQAQKTLLAAIERAAATERDASACAAQALAQQHVVERERQLAEDECQPQARIHELQRTIDALEEQAPKSV